MQKQIEVAVFGGSFDPPHIGHVKIVEKAFDALHVDMVFIVPTYLNPFKKEFVAPPNMRLKWLKKLFSSKNIEVLDFEIKQKRAVSTFETIKYLKKLYDLEKIYLIVGADNFATLESWHRYSELKEMVEFVVASRDETILPKELKKLPINVKISSSKLRSDMDTTFIPHKIKKEIEEFYN